ncbi:MAG: MmcQ/YjbR family DNA-binding protein [Filifactoraceae bacterium]
MSELWIENYLLAMKGVTSDYKLEWEWKRYMIGGKLFAAIMHPSDKFDIAYANKDLINIKCDPLVSEALFRDYKGIMPGFYMDKSNWISVDLNAGIPEDLLKELMRDSYELIFKKLTKKLQKEIIG